jgi:hypothetical protein
VSVSVSVSVLFCCYVSFSLSLSVFVSTVTVFLSCVCVFRPPALAFFLCFSAACLSLCTVFNTGADATDSFDDIGHSQQAKKLLVDKCEFKGMLVGAPEKKSKSSSSGAGGGGDGVGVSKIIVPVLVMAFLAFLVQKFL